MLLTSKQNIMAEEEQDIEKYADAKFAELDKWIKDKFAAFGAECDARLQKSLIQLDKIKQDQVNNRIQLDEIKQDQINMRGKIYEIGNKMADIKETQDNLHIKLIEIAPVIEFMRLRTQELSTS